MALCHGWIPISARKHQTHCRSLFCAAQGRLPDIRTVLSDIMGLTKINYNACNYNDGLPVTIRFANKVGDVLTMGSARDAEKQPLKFYV